MITIPTAELVGLLGDAIPFAALKPDGATGVYNCVRVEFDGQQLHAMATDRYRLGWATWDPDDKPSDDREEDMFTKWGGPETERWQINLPLADAQDIVKIFKLPAKLHGIPLTVEHVFGSLRIVRSKDTGHSAISHVTRGIDEAFPNLRELLDEPDRYLSLLTPVEQIKYDAAKLAAFGKVRQTGPLEMEFTGSTGLTRVRIGERFVGAITPWRDWERIAPSGAAETDDGEGQDEDPGVDQDELPF